MVELFKALSDENRLRMVNLLMNDELCVCEIEVILEMTQSNASRHLVKLKGSGVIDSSKDAQWVHYKVSAEFKKNNIELIKYLQNSFSRKSIFKRDLERYLRYKKHELNCKCIKENKDQVLNLIK